MSHSRALGCWVAACVALVAMAQTVAAQQIVVDANALEVREGGANLLARHEALWTRGRRGSTRCSSGCRFACLGICFCRRGRRRRSRWRDGLRRRGRCSTGLRWCRNHRRSCRGSRCRSSCRRGGQHGESCEQCQSRHRGHRLPGLLCFHLLTPRSGPAGSPDRCVRCYQNRVPSA